MPPLLHKSLPLTELLGFLNFSSGRPDARFHRQLNSAWAAIEATPGPTWVVLNDCLRVALAELVRSGQPAFRETTQASAVLDIAIPKVVPAYRAHHADLLGHLSDAYLFPPFMIARIFEAVLSQGGPWDEADRIVTGALASLNDYVGYRPVPVLETRPTNEPYPDEWFRPIPLYLRDAGAGRGCYEAVVAGALRLLAVTPPALLGEAFFDPALLDELAVDPRGFDPAHPAYRRPNHLYGEWDPHHLDGQGRYRRYVIRKITLDAIMDRLAHPGELPQDELEVEAAALLAGTILMASGLCGDTPTTHGSTTTLAKLLPRVARQRDAFYADLIQRLPEGHRRRLQAEAERTRQAFGGARQHFNQYVTRQRAAQLQARHLAMLFANMGYPDESCRISQQLEPASVRFLCRMVAELTSAQRLALTQRLNEASAALPRVECWLQRGIAVGALVDPWNILGFQARFPLFHSMEDAVHDHRVDELIHIVERTLSLGCRLVTGAAAAGNVELQHRALADLCRLGEWWDQFATLDVSDVFHVSGREMADSAEHVGQALFSWRQRGDAPADIAFWRQHVSGFRSPKAFTLVIDELLRRKDYKASMALMMYWLSQAGHIELEEADHSFHLLALRWMHEVLGLSPADGGAGHAEGVKDVALDAVGPGAAGEAERHDLIRRFFSHLEANAEDFWEVPHLGLTAAEVQDAAQAADEESPFAAAYEGVSYHDSAAGGNEDLLEGGSPSTEFALQSDAPHLEKRLRFLAGVARLWRLTAEHVRDPDQAVRQTLDECLAAARRNLAELSRFLKEVMAIAVPPPFGSEDSVIEFEQRRNLKEQLLEAGIATSLETHLAVRSLTVAPAVKPGDLAEGGGWEASVQTLQAALRRGDVASARLALVRFVHRFRNEPLLYIPLEAGGDPQLVVRVRIAQHTLRQIVAQLPKAGLLRETYQLLQLALQMESSSTLPGRRVTEFDQSFAAAVEAIAEAVADSMPHWQPAGHPEEELVNLLGQVVRPFLSLWLEHSQSLRLSALEAVRTPEEWEELRRFIQRYGGDLFHARFLTLANLRGILHRGVGDYLDQIAAEPDPLHPVRLLADLGQRISRERAIYWLEIILQTIADQYVEYRDYDSSSAHSDYGQNLHVLLDFLRLKSSYDRYAWQFRPIVQMHSVLVRKGLTEAAKLWQTGFTQLSRELVESHLQELDRLERTHGIRLASVADRLNERYVRPLEVGRLCGLIEPAIREAAQGGGPAFARFQEALQPLIQSPTGSGLDVPPWIRQCEQQAQKVLIAERFPERDLAPPALPQSIISLDELRRELPNWNRPLWEALE